jgi:hypothetical protein
MCYNLTISVLTFSVGLIGALIMMVRNRGPDRWMGAIAFLVSIMQIVDAALWYAHDYTPDWKFTDCDGWNQFWTNIAVADVWCQFWVCFIGSIWYRKTVIGYEWSDFSKFNAIAPSIFVSVLLGWALPMMVHNPDYNECLVENPDIQSCSMISPNGYIAYSPGKDQWNGGMCWRTAMWGGERDYQHPISFRLLVTALWTVPMINVRGIGYKIAFVGWSAGTSILAIIYTDAWAGTWCAFSNSIGVVGVLLPYFCEVIDNRRKIKDATTAALRKTD